MAATTVAPILNLLDMVIKDHPSKHPDTAEIAAEAFACLDPNQLSPEPVRFLCGEMLRHFAQALLIARADAGHIELPIPAEDLEIRAIDLERGL